MNLFFRTLLAFAVAALVLTVLVLVWPKRPIVSIELMNRTGGACGRAEIELNGKSYPLKADVPNGNASITGGWPYPMPATATLHWTTEDKIDYSTTIELPPAPRRRTRYLDYGVVILPEGRAKAAVSGWNKPTEAEVAPMIQLMDDLGRDGGPNYRVAVKNMTGLEVDKLEVRFGPYAVNGGTHLSAGGQNYSIATALPYPVTRSATLRWVAGGGSAQERVVDLPSAPSGDFNGSCFWFLLSSDGTVDIRVVDWDDLRAGKYPDLCGPF